MNSKSITKFLLAVSIPLSFGLFWFYSQQKADQEFANYNKDQKEQPTTDRSTVKNYTMQEIGDKNELLFKLRAKEGILMTENHDVKLKDVTIQYFDGEKVKLQISAPEGSTNEIVRNVNLVSIKDKRVEVSADAGNAVLSADKININSKNEFEGLKAVTIKFTDQVSVTADKVTGKFSDTGFEDLVIKGSTRTLIACKPKE